MYSYNIADIACQVLSDMMKNEVIAMIESRLFKIIYHLMEKGQATAPELAEKIGDVDVIITAEAKGIALAYEISRLLGKKEFIVARKSIKSYMCGVVSVSVHSITTSGEQHLYLDGHDAKRLCGKRVCIVDDVISTGESLYALEALVESAKGIVTRKAAVLAEGKAAERDDIIFLQKLPLFHKCDDNSYEIKES